MSDALRSPEVRRAEAAAKRAALAAEREAKAASVAEIDAAVAEERALADDEAIIKAEADFGDEGKMIAVVRTPAGAVILKRAPGPLYNRFQDESANKLTVQVIEKLVRPCRVYPDVATFDRILSDYPATLGDMANAVATLAGARAADVSGK